MHALGAGDRGERPVALGGGPRALHQHPRALGGERAGETAVGERRDDAAMILVGERREVGERIVRRLGAASAEPAVGGARHARRQRRERAQREIARKMHVERSGVAIGGLRREAQKLAPRAAERRPPERAGTRGRTADALLRQPRRQLVEPGEGIGRRQRNARAGMLVEPAQQLVRRKPRGRVAARRQREAHVPLRLDGIVEIGIEEIMLQARELRRTIRRALGLPGDLQDMGLGAVEEPQPQLGEPHVEHDRARPVQDARIR